MIQNFRRRVLRKSHWIWKVFLSRRLLVACHEIWRMARAPVLLRTHDLARYSIAPPTGYLPHNSSILRTPEGWLLAVRAANYKITRDGNHVEGGATAGRCGNLAGEAR